MRHFLYCPSHYEEQRAQAEDGKDVRREDDERISGDSKDRGDGIQREDDVRRLNEHERQQQGRRKPLSVLDGKKAAVVESRRRRDDSPSNFPYNAFFRVRLSVPLKEEPDSSQDEKCSEDVDEPVKALEHRRARQDHHRAQDEGGEDAPEEDAMLIERRDAETVENS